jgi:hypothetical protein
MNEEKEQLTKQLEAALNDFPVIVADPRVLIGKAIEVIKISDKALRDIRKHCEVTMPRDYKILAAWNIANRAINEVETIDTLSDKARRENYIAALHEES